MNSASREILENLGASRNLLGDAFFACDDIDTSTHIQAALASIEEAIATLAETCDYCGKIIYDGAYESDYLENGSCCSRDHVLALEAVARDKAQEEYRSEGVST